MDFKITIIVTFEKLIAITLDMEEVLSEANTILRFCADLPTCVLVWEDLCISTLNNL